MSSRRSQTRSEKGRPRNRPHRDLIKTAIEMISGGSKNSDVRQVWKKSPYKASKRTQEYYIRDVRQTLAREGVILPYTSDLEVFPNVEASASSHQPDQELVGYVTEYIEVNGLAKSSNDIHGPPIQPTAANGPSMSGQTFGSTQSRPSNSLGSSLPRKQPNYDHRTELDTRTPRRRATTLDSQPRSLRTVIEGEASEPWNINRPGISGYPSQSQHNLHLAQGSYTSTSTGLGTSFDSGSTFDRQLWHKHIGESAPISGLSFGTDTTRSSISSTSKQRSIKNELRPEDVMSHMRPCQGGSAAQQQRSQGAFDNSGGYFNHGQTGNLSFYAVPQMTMGTAVGPQSMRSAAGDYVPAQQRSPWNHASQMTEQYSPAEVTATSQGFGPTLEEDYMEPFLTDEAMSCMLENYAAFQPDGLEHLGQTTYWSPISQTGGLHQHMTNADISEPWSKQRDQDIPVYPTDFNQQGYAANFANQLDPMAESFHFVEHDMHDLASSPSPDDLPVKADMVVRIAHTAANLANEARFPERSNPIDITHDLNHDSIGTQPMSSHNQFKGLASMQSHANYFAGGQLTAANLELCPHYGRSSPHGQDEMVAWLEQQSRLWSWG